MTFRRIFSTAVKSYKSTVRTAFGPTNLFYTNVLLSMGISTMGDLLEQSYEIHTNEIEKYEKGRTAHMALSGGTAGLICHHWYILLDKILIGRSIYTVIKKLFLDQFICSPMIILSFFATVALFEDHPLENFTEEVKDKFWTLYKAEWVVWPPAQIINFYFLPTRFRVLYDNTISLGYDIYTSQVKHDRSLKKKKREEGSESEHTTMALGITWRRFSTNIRTSEPVTRLKRLVKVAFSDKYLLYTNVTISISLSSLGDAMEQSYEIYTQDLDKFDGKRTAHMAFSGAAVGVLCHSWYKVLDRVIIGKSLEMVTKKLLLDQLVFSPIMILTFFGSLALFEKHPLENFKSEVGDKFVKLYRAEWMVWPPAQVINFYFLPTRFRVLYDNTISLGYDVYTSQVKHNKCGTQKTVNVLTS